MRRANLSLVGELDNKARDGERALVNERVVDTLGAEVSGEDASVGRQPGNGNANMVVDLKDLALVGGELGAGLVDSGEHDMGLGSETHGGGPLLDGLHGVLHLEQPPRGAPCRHIRVVLVAEHLPIFGIPAKP